MPVALAISISCIGRAEGPVPATRSMGFAEYNSRLWQSDEGLPQSEVFAVAQTADGFVWVGTTRGLTRFDGSQFKQFDNYTPEGLRSSFISVLCPGRDGSLWIGTAGGGLTHYKDGKFKAVPLMGGSERINSVKAILETRDGSLWVGTLGGLFRLKNGAVTHWTTNDYLLDDMVRTLCEVGDGLWIGTSAGINVWKDGVLSSVNPCKGKLVRTLLRDRSGNVWAGFQGGLAMIQNGETKIFTTADGLPDNDVTMLCGDRRGAVWIGTYGGLGRWADGKLRIEQDDQARFFDLVHSIIEDQEGDVWVGCRDGLQELWVKHFTDYSRQNGLSHNNVISVMEDGRGTIWAGTAGGGLNWLENGKVRNCYENQTNAHETATDQILSLGEDRDGSLLVGTDYDGGVFRFANGNFSRWDRDERPLTNRVIRVIYRDRENNVWFGTGSGLVLAGTRQRFLDRSVIRCVLEDHAGKLWVGTASGLFCRSNGVFAPWGSYQPTLKDPITALYEDAQHSLWIGTEHYGLHRWKGGRLTSYNSKNGLLSNEIFEILEDDEGWLWMSCSRGIFRVRKQELDDVDRKKAAVVRCISYGKADGMESVQCSGVAKPGSWKGKDGRLWFATTKGMVVTDPKMALGSNDLPPKVQIEEVIGDRRPATPSVQPGAGSHGPGTNVFKLPPGSGNLEVHYAALSFPAPQKVRFKYKLEGVDPDWVEVPRRVAYYNHLAPGQYRFRVLACNNEGVWNNAGASIQVWLEPQYWQRLWFKALVAVASAFAVAGLAWILIRQKLRRQLYVLEQERAIERERIRIARDMHDEIGAKLTRISFLGAAAKRKLALPDEAGAQIEKMSVTARDVIRSLDEIVWALNPANDSVEDLANYLSRYATEFFDNSPIACHLDIPEELPALKLGMDVRHNVILAAKEALNNVLKHSGATTVNLNIFLAEGELMVEIGDNGHGFNLETVKAGAANGSHGAAPPARTGNGLANMRQRLESIGGQCRVESAADSGTRIKFSIALAGKTPVPPSRLNGAEPKESNL